MSTVNHSEAATTAAQRNENYDSPDDLYQDPDDIEFNNAPTVPKQHPTAIPSNVRN